MLQFHPGYGSILICDFNHQMVPEMVKKRPVVVISRKSSNSGLCTVVPLSNTVPTAIEPWHAMMSREHLPQSMQGKDCWAKCDCLTTVCFARLDRIKIKDPRTGARRYIAPKLHQADLNAIRSAILDYLGMSDLIRAR